jgi:hypothetical protein
MRILVRINPPSVPKSFGCCLAQQVASVGLMPGSWIAAAAIESGTTLPHKDPEFRRLHALAQERLV